MILLKEEFTGIEESLLHNLDEFYYSDTRTRKRLLIDSLKDFIREEVRQEIKNMLKPRENYKIEIN